MELPSGNNVYGLLSCDGRLEELAHLLRGFFGAGSTEVSVTTSQFDGAQTLRMRTEIAELDACFSGADRKFLFNGAVAGSTEHVCLLVERLHKALRDGGFEPKLEVYNDEQELVAAFDA